MKFKVLMNSVPIVAIFLIGSVIAIQAWQRSQAVKPSYEGSSTNLSRPTGQPPQTTKYQVARVLDGDTIKLDNGQSVRFCGIDAPETAHKGKAGQPLGEESKANLQKLINASGNTVFIMQTDTDRYGRMVGEVFTKMPNSEEEKFLNGEQVRSGLAYEYKQYSSSCPNREIIATSEERAKAENKGLWARNDQKPWDFRKQQRGRSQ